MPRRKSKKVSSDPPGRSDLDEKLDPFEIPGFYDIPYPPPCLPPRLNPDLNPSRSTKRRWRRQACKARREKEEVSSSHSTSPRRSPLETPRARSPAQFVSRSGEHPPKPPNLNRPLLAAIERVWDLERNTDHDIHDDTPPLFATPDLSNLGEVAEHASLMLDVFSHVKPVNDREITVVQKGLVTAALTSVLTITQQLRVLSVSANGPLEPLPAVHDDTLKIDSGCIICFARVADILLMPCRHLSICEVCYNKIDETQIRARSGSLPGSVRCPICRNDVVDRVCLSLPTVNLISCIIY